MIGYSLIWAFQILKSENKKLKIESIQHLVPLWGKSIRANIFP